MRLILLLFIFTTFLFSQELLLDNMLKEYEDSESLYKKTKQESAGHLLVYSRDDLDKMQAYSLKDVLKTVRLYTMQVNNTGAIGILNSTAGKTAMPPIKLYIDDFEVSTVMQKNALDMYVDMDIYFVDHIEIYQGGSSIAFGNEPGSMVIRLYSKDPKRENSTSAQIGIDSKSGANLRALSAGTTGDYNYLIYANSAKVNNDKYSRNNQEVSRDDTRYQAHFKISQDDNFAIEIDAITTKSDIFSGFGSAPTGGDSTKTYAYIKAVKYLPNDFILSLGAAQERKILNNTDAFGIGTSLSNDIQVDVKSHTYKADIQKKIVNGNSDLLLGIEIQKKEFKIKSCEGLPIASEYKPDSTNIYMIYLEELYNLNENHLLAFSAKLDRYENNIGKSSNEYSIRLGYIAVLNEAWSSKIFAIRRYTAPKMLQTSFTPPSYKPNPNLESSYIDMLSGELEYKNDKNRLVFGGAYKEISDSIALSQTSNGLMYINKDSNIYFQRYYVRAEHQFNINNKITLEVFKAFKEVDGSPDSGGLIQVFNTIGKFDIYNELVYRSGVTLNYGMGDFKLDQSYDYTLSISYKLNKHINVKAKGENLLDKAIKSPIDAQGLLQIPAVERRAILTMEYTF